jgi:hypothetical protein
MQRTGNGLQVVFRVLLAQYRAAIRINEDGHFAPVVVHHELRATGSVGRWQVLADRGLGVGRLGALQLLVGAQGVLGGLNHEQVAVHQRVELGFEQVDDTGQGQQDHERGDEEAGIEVPTPGQVVEGHFLSGHHWAPQGFEFFVWVTPLSQASPLPQGGS